MAVTTLIPEQLKRDIVETLKQLRAARTEPTGAAEIILERRLNYLLAKIPREPEG